MTLRIVAPIVALCIVCLNPTLTYAKKNFGGPELDPIMVEEESNITLTCPLPITVTCDANIPYQTYAQFQAAGGSANLDDGCVIDSFTWVEDNLISQDGCDLMYMRIYFIQSSCNNTFTCNQFVMLTDDDDPFLTNCPSDITLTMDNSGGTCLVSYTVPEVIAMDGCSDATVTNDSPGNFPLGNTTVTYTATDGCGNTSTCSFSVTVLDNNPLSVTCPPNISNTTACDISEIPPYDIIEFLSAGGTITGNCSGSTNQTLSSSDAIVSNSCPIIINRTYTAMDDSNNSGSCMQTITIIDDTNPTFTAPPTIEVDCGMIQDTSITGAPTNVIDNCDTNPTITYIDSDPTYFTSGCTGEYSLIRSWIVTDACMNADTISQTITTIDTIAPTAICVDTFIVYLDSIGNAPFEAASLDNGSFDNCSQISFTSNMTVVGCNQVAGNVPTIVTLTDSCGNASTCDIIVTILDTMSITLLAPTNDTFPCLGDLDPPFDNYNDYNLAYNEMGDAVDDNCLINNTLELINADTTGICPQIVSRTYEYIDNSGNSDTAIHTIVIIDEEDPIIVSCPADINIIETEYCDTLISFGIPSAMDNCGEVIITNDYTNNTDTSAVFEGGTTTIVFTATDPCGNTDTCSMTITVAADPRITFPPLGEINSESEIPSYDNLQEFLDAGGMINTYCLIDDTTFTYMPDFEILPNPCEALFTEVVTFTDTLGNIYSDTQETILMDTISPVITSCGNRFVPLIHETCTFDTSAFSLPNATDNFALDTTYFSIGTFVQDTAVVTYTAEDECGNSSECMFNLIILDLTSPDIEIDDITIMCDTIGAAPIYGTIQEFLTGPNASVYDCRLDSATFSHMGDVTLVDGSIDRTYTIDDFTGNTGTVTYNITVLDVTAPTFTSCPNDTIVGTTNPDTCFALVDLPTPIFNDNCSGSSMGLTLSHNSIYGVSANNADGEYPVGDTEVSYFVTDGVLSDTCTFTVTVQDTLPPTISCISDTLISCTFDNYSFPSTILEFTNLGGSVSDNCDIVTMDTTMQIVSTTEINITYTFTDQYIIENSCTQNIQLYDTIAPVIDCPSNIFVLADPVTCSAFVNIPTPTGTDNCSAGIAILTNSLTGSADPSGMYSDTTEISWYGEDSFGNIDTCSYLIIIMDNTSPSVTNPPDVTVMCSEMAEDVDTFFTINDVITAGGSVSDACGVETFGITDEFEIGDSIIRRIYLAVDSTGNESTLIQNIIIRDTVPPTFDIPADVTIDCSIATDSVDFVGAPLNIEDNCMEPNDPTYIDQVHSGNCPTKDSILRIWILTDDSGNEIRDTQTIVTIDTVAPVFDKMPDALADINCDEDYPAFENLTAQDSCSSFVITVDTISSSGTSCTGYSVLYRWTATDDCGNEAVVSTEFDVLSDNTMPVFVSDNDQVLNTLPDTCGYPVDLVERPIFTEDCTEILMVSDFHNAYYPVGVTQVTWSVSSCGGDTTVIQEIEIVDNIPPVVICQDLNVSLGGDGMAIVQADTLAKTITDNCDHYFGNSTKVRRLDLGTACTNDGQFNNSIIFCCDDIGKTIMVEVQVTDDGGNANTCTANITIRNNSGISLVQGLPDINISCEYLFDMSDLSIFGSYVTDPSDQEDIRIEDSFYAFDSIAGQDGLYLNTCNNTTITETHDVNPGSCGRDTILRSFKFNNGTDSLTLIQRIYRQDVNLFNASGLDIEWPVAFDWNQCANPAPDTSISGAPVLINNDYCSQVAVTFKDQLFNYPLTSCPFVKRKWKVIDWCQYDDSGSINPGLWEYSQFIYVTNDVAPTILSVCNDTLICAPGNSCNTTLDFSISAEDDCAVDAQNLYYKYRIDVLNDGDISNDLTGLASSFSHEVQSGTHKVYWFVEDRCGNIAECDFLVTAKECKDPTPICHDGLSIDLSGGSSIELWASDVDRSSQDNCTAQSDLLLSFSADTEDNLVTFTCDDLGDQEVQLWVTDQAGNQSYCVATINVQDNSNGCNNLNVDENPLVGFIVTENNVAVAEAMVSISGAEMDGSYETEENGMYAFQGIDIENDYEVNVERDIDHIQGVTTLDLVMIQRHILGLESLPSPYKLIAADINNSESITSSDLLALRKLILGIDETFQDNTSWRFVSKNTNMEEMDNPWPFTEDLTLIGGEQNTDIQPDFVGVKIGDVNNTAEGLLGESIENRNESIFGIYTEDKFIKRDDQVYIDMVSNISMDIEAMQMTITWNPTMNSLVDLIPIGLAIDDVQVNMDRSQEGIITIAWHTIDAVRISEGTPLFQLIMEGNKNNRLSDHLEINSELTEAIVYDGGHIPHSISLSFGETVNEDIFLFQNKPNPFLAETVIEFTLPEQMEVTFKVFDNSGKLIYKVTGLHEKGQNSFTLGDQIENYSGILFLKMESAEFSDVKRMIKIE